MPIASLPILNGKMYAVFDAGLIQSVYRNKAFSFMPFVQQFAKGELNLDEATNALVCTEKFIQGFFQAIHKGMATHHVNQMNAIALNNISEKWDDIKPGQELVIPNVFLWARDMMTIATAWALYGPENPITEDKPEVLEDIWCVILCSVFRWNVFASHKLPSHNAKLTSGPCD